MIRFLSREVTITIGSYKNTNRTCVQLGLSEFRVRVGQSVGWLQRHAIKWKLEIAKSEIEHGIVTIAVFWKVLLLLLYRYVTLFL